MIFRIDEVSVQTRDFCETMPMVVSPVAVLVLNRSGDLSKAMV